MAAQGGHAFKVLSALGAQREALSLRRFDVEFADARCLVWVIGARDRLGLFAHRWAVYVIIQSGRNCSTNDEVHNDLSGRHLGRALSCVVGTVGGVLVEAIIVERHRML